MPFKFFFILLLLFTFTSCSKIIQVRSQYLDKFYLASEQIDTADPNRLCFIGQKVIVKWHLPHCYWEKENLKLIFTVRYGNLETESFVIPIRHNNYFWQYMVVGEEYIEKQGMNSYKAEIYLDETKLASWYHHTWVEMIQMND